jgi:hypothetical protein
VIGHADQAHFAPGGLGSDLIDGAVSVSGSDGWGMTWFLSGFLLAMYSSTDFSSCDDFTWRSGAPHRLPLVAEGGLCRMPGKDCFTGTFCATKDVYK